MFGVTCGHRDAARSRAGSAERRRDGYIALFSHLALTLHNGITCSDTWYRCSCTAMFGIQTCRHCRHYYHFSTFRDLFRRIGIRPRDWQIPPLCCSQLSHALLSSQFRCCRALWNETLFQLSDVFL